MNLKECSILVVLISMIQVRRANYPITSMLYEVLVEHRVVPIFNLLCNGEPIQSQCLWHYMSSEIFLYVKYNM